jgi:tetratricopeptide (TPR) repeat protein
MRRFGLAALCALAIGGFAPRAHADNAQRPAAASGAGGQCVAPSVHEAATSCDIAGRGPRVRRTGSAPTSQLRAVTRPAAEATEQTTAPGFQIDLAREAGIRATQQRARGLLDREVQILQRLVRNTRQNNPQRPEILLRLAETYFEMQTAVNAEARAFDERIFQTCTQQPNRQQCQANRQAQQRAEAQLTEVRQATNRTYATLVQDHPDFRDMDRVLFSLAFGLEQLRQHEQARQVYHRLIKGFPESRFIPHAYLSFAEFFFNDPDNGDMTAALRFYSKVVEFPPERNPVYGYAIYKSAWARYNLDDFQGALESFARVIEFAESNSSATDAENLARQARKELVIPYSRVGNPSRAFAFFQRYARDRAGAIEMLEALAELYFDTGKWDEAVATYHNLMSLEAQSDRLCYWQSKVTNAIISSRQKSEQVEELGRLVRVYEAFMQRQGADAAAQLECKAETAGILVWLATSWHRETVGTSDSPGTMDRPTMGQAAQLYTMLVERFPDMEQLEFPNIQREDWPTRYRVQYYLAELLWKMEDWERCGPAFDDVVDLNPRGEFTEDAAYAAVLCYNNLYQTQYQGRERDARTEAEETPRRGRRGRGRNQPSEEEQEAAAARQYARRDLTRVEQGMVNAFTRYVCVVEADAQDLVQIKYRKARIYYEANHFEEASVLFHDIALNHSQTEYGEFAANLYLDSLNVLGTMQEPNRPECIVELTENIDPMAQRYCASESDREAHGDICEVVATLQCQASRALAESLQSTQRYREAAVKYVEMFRRNVQLPADQQCGAMDEILWNAAINYEAARLLGRAIQIRQVLIREYPDSALSKKSIYLLGANFHSLAYYEQAASFYEQFARQYAGETGEDCTEEERNESRCPDAVLALRNATLFRLGLGQEEQALEDIELFETNYRRSRATETAQVAFAMGALYEQREMWDHLIRYYRRFLRDYRRTAAPHQIVLANVALGRAFLAREEPRDARGHFTTAVRAWNGGAAQAINRISGMSDADKVFALRQAIDATAEAMFRLAEDKYNAFRQVRFPAYEGGRSLERINQWAQRDFAQWVQRKLSALRSAEEDYNAIAALQVEVQGVAVKSPAWQIAAAARSGTMYREFVDHFRNAPIPTVIENDPDLYDVYAGALDEQSQPLLDTATERFLFCLRTATNVRWFNEWSRQCESELNRLKPAEYPIAAELRAEPTFVYSSPALPGVVELGSAQPDENLGSTSGGQGQ